MTQSRSVLLIDDDKEVHALVKHHLEGVVERVETEEDSEAGLVAARQNSPNLILLDLQMPGKDGFAVLAELREADETRNIPVIFLTANDDRESVVAGLEAGAVDYITKPFDVPVFQARVRSAMRRGSSPKEAQDPDSLLVIDDDPAVHDLINHYLGKTTIIHHASRSHEGMALARALRPQVILLDLHLPETNGFQVCGRIRSMPEAKNTSIILITSDTGAYRMAAGIDRGAVDYITKPFDKAILKARVRAAARRVAVTG